MNNKLVELSFSYGFLSDMIKQVSISGLYLAHECSTRSLDYEQYLEKVSLKGLSPVSEADYRKLNSIPLNLVNSSVKLNIPKQMLSKIKRGFL